MHNIKCRHTYLCKMHVCRRYLSVVDLTETSNERTDRNTIYPILHAPSEFKYYVPN